MGGGLLQLVAYGAQDIYLSGNPQITFWKVVYRRHTNFAIESIEQTFNGTADFDKKVTCTISRNGDLIHRIYLQATLPEVDPDATTNFAWANWVGHVLVKSVEVEIGGQRIDKHYSHWLHIWNELTQTPGHQVGYANMVGNVPGLTKLDGTTKPSTTLYVPLQFWFCRNPGLALPLIALQYHEVKINLEFGSKTECSFATTVDAGGATIKSTFLPGSLNAASLYVDYVYLDTDERRRMAQVSHEYLIEQLQFTGLETAAQTNYKAKLNFNHPCKEIIWVCQPEKVRDGTVTSGPQHFNFTDAVDANGWGTPLDKLGNGMPGGALVGMVDKTAMGVGVNPTKTARLQLNGHDRFSERHGRYFNLVQPFQHHTNIPAPGVNVYSFGLKPEEHQPSGSANMSRIDNATLFLTLTDTSVNNDQCDIRIYATNYNVLRIMSGMGGLAYAN